MCSPKVNEKSALPFPNHDFIEYFCISLTSLYSHVNIIVNNIVHKGKIHFSTYLLYIKHLNHNTSFQIYPTTKVYYNVNVQNLIWRFPRLIIPLHNIEVSDM